MSALALVTQPSSLAAIHQDCDAVDVWAEGCESISELREVLSRLSAVSDYLASTSKEGRGRYAETMRRLEVRIGKLLGPASPNGAYESGSVATDPSITRHERNEFRQMAENDDVVEDVIANSTDDQPASRRKVMRAIKGDAPQGPVLPPTVGNTRALPRTKSPTFILRNVAERLDGTISILQSLDIAEVEPTDAAELAASLSSFRSVLSTTINQLRSRT